MSSDSDVETIKLIAGAVLFLTLMVGLWMYLRPTSGVHELQLSRDAVREATSWHSLHSIRQSDGSWLVSGTRDVVCPTDFDETNIHYTGNAGSERRVELQGYFYHQHPDGTWERMGNGFFKIPDCGRGPYLDPFEHIYADLDEIRRTGKVIRGDALDSDGVKCQWWHVTTANPAEPKYSVCIEESTHLPMIATSLSYGFSYAFSKWNQTTVTSPIPDPTPSSQ